MSTHLSTFFKNRSKNEAKGVIGTASALRSNLNESRNPTLSKIQKTNCPKIEPNCGKTHSRSGVKSNFTSKLIFG